MSINVRATAELHTCVPPLRVLDVLGNIIDVELKRHNPYRIRVGLAKDSAQTGDLLGGSKVELLGEDAHIALDPVLAQVFDFLELRDRDLGFVREVKAELCRSDKGAFLVDVVAEYLTKGIIENVRASVVVPERPTAELSSHNTVSM